MGHRSTTTALRSWPRSRLSPHYYHTEEEVDQVAAAVEELSNRGPR